MEINAALVSLILQAGFAGIAVLLIIIGFRALKEIFVLIGEKLDNLTDKIAYLTSMIVDHKAREGDTPPGRIERRRS